MRARYDGLADWYEERFVAGAEPHQPGLLDLLGPGSGPCLDIGCGTGRNFETIRATGRASSAWTTPPTSSGWPGRAPTVR